MHLRVQRTDRSAGATELPEGGTAEAGQGCGYADRADLRADAGRPASLRQESRRGLLSGTAAGTQKIRSEGTADAHQQRRRPVAKVSSTGSVSHPWRDCDPEYDTDEDVPSSRRTERIIVERNASPPRNDVVMQGGWTVNSSGAMPATPR
jgi:hypothetical protein